MAKKPAKKPKHDPTRPEQYAVLDEQGRVHDGTKFNADSTKGRLMSLVDAGRVGGNIVTVAHHPMLRKFFFSD
jgi:hypothetical protein